MRDRLYTATAFNRSHAIEATMAVEGRKPRYHLRAGLDYLHWSASFLTRERKQAWVGTVEQARACRRTFSAAAGCKIASISPIPQHQEQGA